MSFASIFGTIGLLCMILSVVCNEKQKVLFFLKLKAIFYGIQYFCLGATSGCISMFLGLLRADLISRKEKNPKIAPAVLAFLIIVYTISSIVTFESAIDILSVLGNASYLITLWCFKNIGIKIGTLISTIIWTTYNFIVGAYAAGIGNLIVIGMLIIFIFKYYNKNNKLFKKLLKAEEM